MTNKLTINDPFTFIDRADLGEKTKTQYKRMLKRAVNAGVDFRNIDDLVAFADTLPNSGKALLKSSIGLWSKSVELEMKGQANPHNVRYIQAALYRLESISDSLTVKAPQGQKTHVWLNRSQVIQLLDHCQADTNQCKRDKLIIGLLVGAGLRRDELVNLTFDMVKKQPYNDKTRTVLAIKGKGKKDRTIPISEGLAQDIDAWKHLIGDDGPIIRSVNKSDRIGHKLSGYAIAKVVKRLGTLIDVPELASHDLRRTYARIGYDNGISIAHISRLLGHSNTETTERYLNIEVTLDQSICDFVPYQ